ncbi:MAG: ABC-2 family transporter protein [Defluviitaleaceae bacterium]|nr:ABC-2 family transporter protein [Defluviitaleaceae bacterium]
MLKKYLKVFKISFQLVFQYRFNVVLQMFFGFLPLIALISLWHSLFTDNNTINGYSIEMMVTYLIVAKVIDTILMPDMHWQVNEDIKTGELSKYLTKPISYFSYWFFNSLGNRIVRILLSIIPISIVIILNMGYFLIPNNFNLLFFIISLIGTMILYYMIYYLVSLFSFYFVEITSFFFTLEIVLELLSGSLIPLDFLPNALRNLINFLPFGYLVHFNINIYLNRLEFSEILYGFTLQFFWSLFLYVLIKILWKKGLNKYESVGA